jgi:hypothetical protein
MWKFHRNMSRPYFSRDRISHFDIFARNSDKAISKILSRLAEPVSSGAPVAVDFQEIVQRSTLDSSTEFLFGRNVSSLDAPLPYPHTPKPKHDSTAFSTAFAHVQEMVMMRFSFDMLWPWMELWWDRTAEDMRVIDSYLKPILKERIDQKRTKSAP